MDPELPVQTLQPYRCVREGIIRYAGKVLGNERFQRLRPRAVGEAIALGGNAGNGKTQFDLILLDVYLVFAENDQELPGQQGLVLQLVLECLNMACAISVRQFGNFD